MRGRGRQHRLPRYARDNLTACVGAAPEAEEPAEPTAPEEEAETAWVV